MNHNQPGGAHYPLLRIIVIQGGSRAIREIYREWRAGERKAEGNARTMVSGP